MRDMRNALVGLLLTMTLGTPSTFAQSTAASPEPPRQAASAADRVEQRIASLHARLRITPAEQPLWDKFAQVMRDNAQKLSETAGERAAKLKDMNASDNMQSYAQLAMVHAQDLQNLTTAFQPLYASFSPEQQREADTMFRNVALRRAERHQH